MLAVLGEGRHGEPTYRGEGAVCSYPVAWLALFLMSVPLCGLEWQSGSDLVLSGAYAGPDERIGAEIALDVGRDDFACDAIARDEPLVCARHG